MNAKIAMFAIVFLMPISLTLLCMNEAKKEIDWPVNTDNGGLLRDRDEKPYWQAFNDNIKSTRKLVPFCYPTPETIPKTFIYLLQEAAFVEEYKNTLRDELEYRKNLQLPEEKNIIGDYEKNMLVCLEECKLRLSKMTVPNK